MNSYSQSVRNPLWRKSGYKFGVELERTELRETIEQLFSSLYKTVNNHIIVEQRDTLLENEAGDLTSGPFFGSLLSWSSENIDTHETVSTGLIATIFETQRKGKLFYRLNRVVESTNLASPPPLFQELFQDTHTYTITLHAGHTLFITTFLGSLVGTTPLIRSAERFLVTAKVNAFSSSCQIHATYDSSVLEGSEATCKSLILYQSAVNDWISRTPINNSP